MPELPEVETTRRGIEPHLLNQKISHAIIRQPRLRWAIPAEFAETVQTKTISSVTRRAKYLLLALQAGQQASGTILIHLGMSGGLRILPADSPPQKHDHVDIVLTNGQCLRYHDPRRFGCILWTQEALNTHVLLKNLGVEPLTPEFTGQYLFERAQNKAQSIKTWIMDGKIVVGVGNIYASESLFLAGILPTRAASSLTLNEFDNLVAQIKIVLAAAIEQGGTTLRDFSNSEGKAGYFQQFLRVYDRKGKACVRCQGTVEKVVLGQRATYFCAGCQK